MENIIIVGTGAYGTALASVLSDNKHNITMIGVDKDEVNDINVNKKNSKYFPNLKLNKTIKATTNWENAIENAEVIVLAIPSQFLQDICVKINKYVKKRVIIVNASKGFAGTKNIILPYEELKEKLKSTSYEFIGGIYGPSIASEVISKKPVFITAASNNLENAKKISKIFSNNYFSVFPSENILLTEFSVILKNIYAIGAGMAASIFKSDSSKSSIIALSIFEMQKIISIYRNISVKTLSFDLASMADIILTTSTNKSRNYTLGYYIGENDSAKDALNKYAFTVEGLNSCKLLFNDLQERGYDFPLLTILYEIMFENKKPSSFLYSVFNLQNL